MCYDFKIHTYQHCSIKQNNAYSIPNPTKETYLEEITAFLGERLSISESVREHHGHDESFHASVPPDAVAYAQNNHEVAEIVKICVRYQNLM